MAFYTYIQKNSGGQFKFDKTAGITHYVIIEASSPEEADIKAESIGLYFDGVSAGRDCGCCGDRWYPADTYYPQEFPALYGDSIYSIENSFKWMEPGAEAVIHYADGHKEWLDPGTQSAEKAS